MVLMDMVLMDMVLMDMVLMFAFGLVLGSFGSVGFAWLPWKKPKIKVSIPDFEDIDFALPFKSFQKKVMVRMVRLHVELENVQNPEPEIDARLGIITKINPTHPQPLFWVGESASVDEGHDIVSHNFSTPEEGVDHAFKYHFSKAGTFRRASGMVNVAVKFKGLEGFFLPIKTREAAHIRDPGKYKLPIEFSAPIIEKKVKKVKIVSKKGTDLDDLQIIR